MREELASKNQPTMLVIFGIRGDLSRRKLLPALYHLEKDDLLPDKFHIFGTTRQDLGNEFSKENLYEFITTRKGYDRKALQRLKSKVSVVNLDITKVSDYPKLREKLSAYEASQGVCFNILHYLALPPDLIETVIKNLGEGHLNTGCSVDATSRLLIEKPFGSDLETAKKLAKSIKHYFKEDQIYRVDHYLAKETAQNIMTFRFHNPLLRGIWSSKFIKHIQITAAEQIDIQGRATFYEQTGALRDIIQSHLLQLLTVVTMEEPKDFNSKDIHQSRTQLLNSVKPIAVTKARRGQYKGYKTEVNNKQSSIETFVAVKLDIDNPRWQKIPIVLRAGKALKETLTSIVIYFDDENQDKIPANKLEIRIQPHEGITLTLHAKKPGLERAMQDIEMAFCYHDLPVFEQHDAYEQLLVHAMSGDQTLFPTTEEILQSWRIVEKVIKAWRKDTAIEYYDKESWGPEAANDLLADTGFAWQNSADHVCKLTPRRE